MNRRQLFERRNKVRQLIRISNRNRDCLKWDVSESEEHVNKKFEVCKWLKKQGKEFYTEAILLDGQRCDVISADDAEIIEVVHTESLDSIEAKRRSYPLPIRVVRVGEVVQEVLG